MNTKIKKYEDLRIWQMSHRLSVDVYKVTSKFPRTEVYGLASQMRRCASSVSANVVEGYYRNSKKEFIQFLYIARGSAGETTTFLLLAKDLNYISPGSYNRLRNDYEKLIASISALINSLNKK